MVVPRKKFSGQNFSEDCSQVDQYGKVSGERVRLQQSWLLGHTELQLYVDGSEAVTLYEEHCAHDSPIYIQAELRRAPSCNIPFTYSVMGKCYNVQHSAPVLLEKKNRTVFKMQTCTPNDQVIRLEVCQKAGLPLGSASFIFGMFESERGTVSVPLIGSDNLPVGILTASYVLVKPSSVQYTMERGYNYTQEDLPADACVFGGHRGTGTSRNLSLNHRVNCSNAHENSIKGVQMVFNSGSDLVEVDVVLTKDKVPIVHHDFTTCISGLEINGGRRFAEVPIHELTHDDLQSLWLEYASSAGKKDNRDEAPNWKCTAEDKHSQPFVSLKDFLLEIDEGGKVLLEMKYPQDVQSGSFEDGIKEYGGRNAYVEIILKTLNEFAGNRQIILGSFDVDVMTCAMRKQNRYSGLLIHQGRNDSYEPYKDMRAQTVSSAIHYCKCLTLMGIHGFSENYFKYDSVKLIRENDLVCFCWGDDFLKDWDDYRVLMDRGVQGFVVDSVTKLAGANLISKGKCPYK